MARLRERVSIAYRETYLTTIPIMSPSLGGLWMQLAPKALWARVVAWVTNPRATTQREGDEVSEVEWAEDVLACLLDPDEPQFFSSAQAAVIINERLALLESEKPLTDRQRLEFIDQALRDIPWA